MTGTRSALLVGGVLLCTCALRAFAVDYVELLADPAFVFGHSTTVLETTDRDRKTYRILGSEGTGIASVYEGGFVVDATKLSPGREVLPWKTVAPNIVDFVQRTWPALELTKVLEQPDFRGMYNVSFRESRSGLDARTLSLSVACWNGRICHLHYREETDWLNRTLPPPPPPDVVRAACMKVLLEKHPELKGLAVEWVDVHRFWSRATQALYWVGTLRCQRDADVLAIGVTLTDDLRPLPDSDCILIEEVPKPRPVRTRSVSLPFIAEGSALGWITTSAIRGFPAWSTGHQSILVPHDHRLVAVRPLPYDLYSPATYEKVTWLPEDRLLVTGFAAGEVTRSLYLVDLTRMVAVRLARTLPQHYRFTMPHTIHPGDDFALAVAENRETGKRNLCYVSITRPDWCELLNEIPGSRLSSPAVGPAGLICYASYEAGDWWLRTARLSNAKQGRLRLKVGNLNVKLPEAPRQIAWSHDTVLILTRTGRLFRTSLQVDASLSVWEVRRESTSTPLRVRWIAGSPSTEAVGLCAVTAEPESEARMYLTGPSGIARPVPEPEAPVEYLGVVRQTTAIAREVTRLPHTGSDQSAPREDERK